MPAGGVVLVKLCAARVNQIAILLHRFDEELLDGHLVHSNTSLKIWGG